MILQSLVSYYEGLAAHGKIAPSGWSDENVSYKLEISDDGSLKEIVSLKISDGKKLIPQKMKVPAPVKRSSGVSANFLFDNSSYFLGYDQKGKPERARECFQAAAAHHRVLLDGIDEPAVLALLRFFESWDVEQAAEHPLVKQHADELAKGANLIFSYRGKFLQDFPAVQAAWEQHLSKKSDEQLGRCSVTGKEDTIAVLHPALKKVKNAQSAGASLVSFNAPAFCSFGKEQGMNAQTGAYAAGAYGAALQYLIDHMDYRQYTGDTAVLYYALDSEEHYQEAMGGFLFGMDTPYKEQELYEMLKQLCQGRQIAFNDALLNPQMQFFVLGIAPNAARLSVRFFHTNTFGGFVKNIDNHQARLEIDRGDTKPSKTNIPIYRILWETYREGGKVSDKLGGELLRAVINDMLYPATLLNAVDVRILADHKVNATRAAIIKAYYLKNKNTNVEQEVLTVGLNKETKDTAYNLGRLFAVLEKIQEAANPGINTTIKDKFFGSASATPATAFPNLINLSNNHLRKLDAGLRIYYEKMLGEIMEKLEEFPASMNMPKRGAFQLGYYHQVQELYRKSEKTGEKNA